MSQKIVVRMLERLGVKKTNVVVTDDGKEAVDAESQGSFDIVLLDIQMVCGIETELSLVISPL